MNAAFKLIKWNDGNLSTLTSPLTVIVLQEGTVIHEGTVLQEGTVFEETIDDDEDDDGLVEHDVNSEIDEIVIEKEEHIVKEEEVIVQSQIHCETCGTEFHDESEVEKHRESCEQVKYYSLKCKPDSENGLRLHRRLHSRDGCTCEKCGKHFRVAENLQAHQREECGREPSLSCVLCGEKFHFKAHLNAHLIENHSEAKVFETGEPSYISSSEERYNCKVCPRSFTRVGSLNYHVSRKHSGPGKEKAPDEFPYLCHDCGNRYKSGTQLCRHRRWECGKEPMFKCQLCVKKFHHRHGLKQHIGRHLARRGAAGKTAHYCCEKCGRGYKLKSSLNSHIRWECGKEPIFECTSCNVKFAYKGNLKKHIMTKHVKNMDTDLFV